MYIYVIITLPFFNAMIRALIFIINQNCFLCNINTSYLNLYSGVTLWILHAIYFLEKASAKQKKKTNDDGKRPAKKRSVYAVSN